MSACIENDTNRGKGYSVRRGFADARGDRLVFIDADLSLPVEGLDAMLARFDLGADVVIASRTAPGSRVEGAPPAMRDVMSKVFNFAVQALAVPGISDTQCGFKGFTAHAAKKIFSVAESDRFGFDVEALYLARRHGFRIDELPVVCRYHGGSSVSRVSDGVRMFADIWRSAAVSDTSRTSACSYCFFSAGFVYSSEIVRCGSGRTVR